MLDLSNLVPVSPETEEIWHSGTKDQMGEVLERFFAKHIREVSQPFIHQVGDMAKHRNWPSVELFTDEANYLIILLANRDVAVLTMVIEQNGEELKNVVLRCEQTRSTEAAIMAELDAGFALVKARQTDEYVPLKYPHRNPTYEERMKWRNEQCAKIEWLLHEFWERHAKEIDPKHHDVRLFYELNSKWPTMCLVGGGICWNISPIEENFLVTVAISDNVDDVLDGMFAASLSEVKTALNLLMVRALAYYKNAKGTTST